MSEESNDEGVEEHDDDEDDVSVIDSENDEYQKEKITQ